MSDLPSFLALAALCSVLGLLLLALAMVTGDHVVAAGALTLHAIAIAIALAMWGGDA